MCTLLLKLAGIGWALNTLAFMVSWVVVYANPDRPPDFDDPDRQQLELRGLLGISLIPWFSFLLLSVVMVGGLYMRWFHPEE